MVIAVLIAPECYGQTDGRLCDSQDALYCYMASCHSHHKQAKVGAVNGDMPLRHRHTKHAHTLTVRPWQYAVLFYVRRGLWSVTGTKA